MEQKGTKYYFFKTRASCFIGVSKHLETIKALALQPRAFICLSVFGYPDETLALVLEIVLRALLSHNIPILPPRLKTTELPFFFLAGTHCFLCPLLLSFMKKKFRPVQDMNP